jgi:hypothetical protein
VTTRCQACRHVDLARIDMLLASGASQRSVARRFSLSKDALSRHWNQHISPERRAQLVAGPVLRLSELAERAASEGLSLSDYLALTRSTLMTQFLAAAEAGDRQGVALLAGKVLQCLSLIAQVNGELNRATASITNNTLIMASPFMADLQAMLITVLAPYPEPRDKVIAALKELSERALQSAAPSHSEAVIAGPPRAS